MVLRTVAERGKQHNPVTGSGGMLLGRVVQVAPGRADALEVGDRIATLVSLSLTPLRIDKGGGRAAFERSNRRRRRGGSFREWSVCEASGRYAGEVVARGTRRSGRSAASGGELVSPKNDVVLVLGAGGLKSGVLCVAEARRCVWPWGDVVSIEANARAADELRALGLLRCHRQRRRARTRANP